MNIYAPFRPLFFQMDPERAHNLVMAGLATSGRVPGAWSLSAMLRPQYRALRTSIAGLRLPNPLGLAAGLDKDARAVGGLELLGFGFLEVGTVTPRPQEGNQRPRLFRLPEDRALINRMGFNNDGAEAMARRLRAGGRHIPLGINIGKNRTTDEDHAAADYLICFRLLAQHADYIAVNVSSPNTPGLRALQRAEPLRELLAQLAEARRGMQRRPPLFVKLSPDETPAALDAALDAIVAVGADGLIATNTTTARPETLRGQARGEAGGLSGEPLRQRAEAVVAYLHRAVGGRLPIIGVGGIDGAEAAYARILAGASVVQLYTALIYQGPQIVPATLRGLAARLARDGFSSVGQAVGARAQQGAEL